MVAKKKTKCSDIQRNAILGLEFLKFDVLDSDRARNLRQKKLQEATFMGNVEEKKVCIEFLSKSGCYTVSTTLWACTDDWVVFKENQRIPVKSIRKVEL